jgi:hypothetical protein
MVSSSQDLEQLLVQVMSQQEVKSQELAAKQQRLIQKLRESSLNEMPSA